MTRHLERVAAGLLTGAGGSPGPRILNPNSEVGTRKLYKKPDWQRVGHATSVKICTRWLQARRARSDAPYHDGRATKPVAFSANFEVRVNNTSLGPLFAVEAA